MEYGIICAGFGGQGILSLGKFIVYSAMEKGLNVTWLPSYGPEMRGGTANCSVVLSDDEIASPIVDAPQCVIAMNKPSFDRFESSVVKGGVLLINSSLIADKSLRNDITVRYVDANGISQSLGDNRSANIVMLGAYTKLSSVVEKEAVEMFLKKQFGQKADKLLAIFEAGYNAV